MSSLALVAMFFLSVYLSLSLPLPLCPSDKICCPFHSFTQKSTCRQESLHVQFKKDEKGSSAQIQSRQTHIKTSMAAGKL